MHSVLLRILRAVRMLSNLGKLKICVAYQKPDGSVIRDFPPTIEEQQLGWERACAHTGGIGFCRADHLVDQRRADHEPALDLEEIIERYTACGKRLERYLADVSVL